jgi:hypothetical protein
VTLIFEKWLIVKLTQHCDDKKIVKKEDEFRIMMLEKAVADWKLDE